MDIYSKQNNIIGWSVSEKHDGVQGVWDGKVLRTRTGNLIAAPAWWTQSLPQRPLTGELWIGRGLFDQASSIVRSSDAGDRWRQIRFMVFDGAMISSDDLGPYAEAVCQTRIKSAAQFDDCYQTIISGGGEGVVIMAPHGSYRLKRKPISDSEGTLIGFKQGKGRNAGRVGSFILQLRNGKRFNLGGGLDDELRTAPPRTGMVIRFTYQGLTSGGLPRFASFSGIRPESSLAF